MRQNLINMHTTNCIENGYCGFDSYNQICISPDEGFDCFGIELISYQVGDMTEGGVVFYVDETGQHGLVAAFEDLDQQWEWGCYGVELMGANGTAIGTGLQNTLDIVVGCTSSGDIAASEALAYESGGFSDWYLPSKDELYEMYNTIGQGSLNGNIGNFQNSWYWSSSEIDYQDAWFVSFNNSGVTTNKYDPTWIRAIRSF